MSNDIGRYGSSDELGYYLVKRADMATGYSELVAIDALGQVKSIGARQPYDEAAWELGEAVLHHFTDQIKAANAVVERRRAEMPDEREAPPHDPATARFLHDGDY